jgi:hypothetical protein
LLGFENAVPFGLPPKRFAPDSGDSENCCAGKKFISIPNEPIYLPVAGTFTNLQKFSF